MHDHHITISSDFSRSPQGGYFPDSPEGGDAFRKNVLAPALRDQDVRVVVHLDGVPHYPPSFMVAAFVRLLDAEQMSESYLAEHLCLVCDNNRHLRQDIRMVQAFMQDPERYPECRPPGASRQPDASTRDAPAAAGGNTPSPGF